MISEKLYVLTSDGRTIVGTLLGHDQVQNLILNDAVECIYSADADMEEEPLGLFVLRGDNVCLMGEFDPAKLNQHAAQPIPPVQQQQF